MEASLGRLHTDRVDLMQVWNLGGPDVLLPILREWKDAGRIRYYGVTTTSDRQYPALLDLMRREPLDFVQVDYSINNRNAATDVLPLAQDRGVAVLTALPFGRTTIRRHTRRDRSDAGGPASPPVTASKPPTPKASRSRSRIVYVHVYATRERSRRPAPRGPEEFCFTQRIICIIGAIVSNACDAAQP